MQRTRAGVSIHRSQACLVGRLRGSVQSGWDGWNQGWAGAGARPAGVGSFSRALGCLFSP